MTGKRMTDADVEQLGLALLGRRRGNHETLQAYIDDLGRFIVEGYSDRVTPRELELRREYTEWTPREAVEWCIDYGDFFETLVAEGEDHPQLSLYYFWKQVYGKHFLDVKWIRDREAGVISADNPQELLTADGRIAYDINVGKRKRKPGEMPFGYEEATAKRSAFRVADQGPLLERHLNSDGTTASTVITPQAEKSIEIKAARVTPPQIERKARLALPAPSDELSG